MGTLLFILLIVAIVLVSLLVIGLIFSKLYKRSTKEQAFVRTGFGGQKVIMDGGAIILPILHETISVNMNTLRLEVKRAQDQALITKDRMRVDVEAAFYVRVKPTKEAIGNAAQTLGSKTMHPAELRDLVEGKFVDSLRSVAAEMEMEELHEKRADFVQKVQQTVAEDLEKNGLELESVSLTGLDQTDQKFFNDQNAFDAAGLTKLTQQIELKRKERNVIQKDTEVAIQQKNLEAEKKVLTQKKEQEYARLEQQREIEFQKAEQASEIIKYKSDKARESKQAEIIAKQQIDQSELDSKQAVDERRIKMEQAIKEQELEKDKIIKTSSIEKEKQIAKTQIEKEKAIEIANQERQIIIENKSKEKSIAEKEASIANAAAIREKEKVTTAKETEIAERDKAIRLIEASKEAEQNAIAIKVAAEAEKQVAIDKAESIKIIAEGEKEAELLKIEAMRKRYEAEAGGKEKIIAAENKLSLSIIDMKMKEEIIKQLPSIIKESVRPMEKIDSIKIFQIDGLNHVVNPDGTKVSNDANFPDQVVTGALKYRTQSALVDQLLNMLGLQGSNLNGLIKPLSKTFETKNKDNDINISVDEDDKPIDLVESISIKEESDKVKYPYALIKMQGDKALVSCPECSTKYNVTDVIKEHNVDVDPNTSGKQLRCKKCSTIFTLQEEQPK